MIPESTQSLACESVVKPKITAEKDHCRSEPDAVAMESCYDAMLKNTMLVDKCYDHHNVAPSPSRFLALHCNIAP